jgi:hypothetical protein
MHHPLAATCALIIAARAALAPAASTGGRRQSENAAFGHFLPGQCPHRLSSAEGTEGLNPAPSSGESSELPATNGRHIVAIPISEFVRDVLGRSAFMARQLSSPTRGGPRVRILLPPPASLMRT